jgi:hypothetical protein
MKLDLFSSLPPELMCMILSQLDTPQDLYSVIRASPLIYTRGFTASREIILRHVVQNALRMSALSEALVAFRFLKSDNPSSDESWDYYQRRLVFLSQLIGEAKAELQPQPTLAESIALCALFRSFEIFAQHCCRQFLAVAKSEGYRQLWLDRYRGVSRRYLKRASSLSDLELGRLQRGFFRYITLQNLIHPLERPSHKYKRVSSEQVAALFVSFTPWEIEEIACVHQYTVNWLRKVLDEVEDDFVESVAATEQPSSSRFLPSGEDKSVKLHSLEAESPFISNDEDELGPEGISWQISDLTEGSSTIMFLESEQQDQAELIEYLATLGFKTFRTLVEADNPLRRSIINRNYHHHHDSLGNALKHRPWIPGNIFRREWHGRQRGQKLEFEGDEYHKSNLAWLWAHQMRPEPVSYETCNGDLRAWGYVFWDSGRLDDLGILKEPRLAQYSSSYPEPEIRPSAQRRLRNMGLA